MRNRPKHSPVSAEGEGPFSRVRVLSRVSFPLHCLRVRKVPKQTSEAKRAVWYSFYTEQWPLLGIRRDNVLLCYLTSSYLSLSLTNNGPDKTLGVTAKVRCSTSVKRRGCLLPEHLPLNTLARLTADWNRLFQSVLLLPPRVLGRSATPGLLCFVADDS